MGDHADHRGVDPDIGQVAIPSITNPMWPTDEKAMRRFMSVWARQASDP